MMSAFSYISCSTSNVRLKDNTCLSQYNGGGGGCGDVDAMAKMGGNLWAYNSFLSPPTTTFCANHNDGLTWTLSSLEHASDQQRWLHTSSFSTSSCEGNSNSNDYYSNNPILPYHFSSLGSPKHCIFREEHKHLLGMRTLCEDRRGPLDHLQPGSLIKNIIRVSVQQGALVYSQYMSDQLKHELAREEEGLHRDENSDHAINQDDDNKDDDDDEWSEKEWARRWNAFPERLATAYMKYHAVTALMRLYEYIASQTMSLVQVDKLTLDPFASATRRTKRGEVATPTQVAQECWHANLIAYLADYSVHQIILGFGYYVYIRDHHQQQQERRRRKQSSQPQQEQQQSSSTSSSTPTSSDQEQDDDENDLHAGSLALSLMKKSIVLGLSRLVCLFFASVGGAVGFVLIPGRWGVLLGINMGDSVGAQMTEEFVNTSTNKNDPK